MEETIEPVNEPEIEPVIEEVRLRSPSAKEPYYDYN
jgi:hypothetical protein